MEWRYILPWINKKVPEKYMGPAEFVKNWNEIVIYKIWETV